MYLVKIGGRDIRRYPTLVSATAAANDGVDNGSWRAIVINPHTSKIVYARDA